MEINKYEVKKYIIELLDDEEIIAKIIKKINEFEKSIVKEQKNESKKLSNEYVEKDGINELQSKLKTKDENFEILLNEFNTQETNLNKSRDELKEKNEKINELEDQLKEQSRLAEILERKNREINREILECEENIRSMQREKKEITNKLAGLIEFEKWVDVYKIFNNLNEETIRSLKGIFKGESILDFIYCGVQENNLSNLWDYIKGEALDGNTEIKYLERIFNEFFSAINVVYENGIYELQEVNVNDEFDDEYYIRTSNSSPSGKIKNILLKGYIQKGNKKIIKKSIVEI